MGWGSQSAVWRGTHARDSGSIKTALEGMYRMCLTDWVLHWSLSLSLSDTW